MSQSNEIYQMLLDYNPHRVDEIVSKIYGIEHPCIARVGSRIFDIKKKYDVAIESWPDPENRKLWWYQLVQKGERQIDFLTDSRYRMAV